MKLDLNSRQIDELKEIIKENESFELSLFLEKYDISSKTLLRDIIKINESLKAYNISLKKVKNKIIIEKNSEANINKLKKYLTEVDSENVTNTSLRKKLIYIDLLNSSPENSSINEIAKKYYIARSSVSLDLAVIKDWAASKNVELVQSIKGTCIKGNELEIRSELSRMLLLIRPKDLHIEEQSLDKRISSNTYSVLNYFYSNEIISYAKKIITILEKKIGYTVSDIYYSNMIVNFTISINRIINGHILEHDISETNCDEVDLSIIDEIKKQLNEIKDRFNCEINENEYMYVYMHVVSSGIGEFQNHISLASYFNSVEQLSGLICSSLINIIEKELNLKINRGSDLYSFFLLHINSLTNRIKYNIRIRNILSDSIIENYASDYKLLKKGFNELAEKYTFLSNINDDEICFLVPYVHSMIEDSKKQLRVLIVCFEGVGTGYILQQKIKKEFPNFEVVTTLSRSKLEQFDFSQVDCILSTIEIEEYLPIPIVVVSPLLNENDIRLIKTTFNL